MTAHVQVAENDHLDRPARSVFSDAPDGLLIGFVSGKGGAGESRSHYKEQ
jgi:hypothetical protein